MWLQVGLFEGSWSCGIGVGINDVMVGLRIPHPGCGWQQLVSLQTGCNIQGQTDGGCLQLIFSCCFAAFYLSLHAMDCFFSVMALCHAFLILSELTRK